VETSWIRDRCNDGYNIKKRNLKIEQRKKGRNREEDENLF